MCTMFGLKTHLSNGFSFVQVRITASWAVANLCDALCDILEADDAKEASKHTMSCTSYD